MTAQLQALRERLRSVNSTRKITRAQELIAASRISGAQTRLAASTPYCAALTAALTALACAAPSLANPLLRGRLHPTRAGVLVITSDRGMCGGYNTKVLDAGEQLQRRLRAEGKEVLLFVLGRKGLNFYTFRNTEVAGSWTDFSQRPSYEDTAAVTEELVALFRAGGSGTVHGATGGVFGVDELHVVSTKFESMLTQRPVTTRIAPLTTAGVERDELSVGPADLAANRPADAPPPPNYEFEPDRTQLLDSMLPKYVRTRIYSAILDSALSELAARRTAMKAATDSANDLVLSLGLQINHARQAQITEEINEIISGADALAADPDDEGDRQASRFYDESIPARPTVPHSGVAESATTNGQAVDVQLRRQTPGATAGSADGTWWPRSLNLVVELPGLLSAVRSAGYEVNRVTYNLTDWQTAPRKQVIHKGVVYLDGYHHQRAASIGLRGRSGWPRIELTVVPPVLPPPVPGHNLDGALTWRPKDSVGAPSKPAQLWL